ncbi:MAG: alpha/beta hydrolase [Blastocatellia bacterium]|nr:alpha/beta hydrolase [Blastocatellia bacterium]
MAFPRLWWLGGIGFMALVFGIGSIPAARSMAQGGQPQTIRNIEFGRVNNVPLLLDLYLPQNPAGPLPVVVWIHGGGWTSGDKSLATTSVQVQQTSRGYAVASINYRLSGTAKFPAQIEDCKAAIRWLRANAGKYGLNPDRIGVWGSSAGGHLVALLGTSGGVAELEGTAGNLDQSSRVQAVVDWFGPGNLATMASQSLPCSVIDHNSANSPESQLVGCALPSCPDKAAAASPVTYVTPDEPPFLLMHGTMDCVVPPGQSQELFDRLKAAGVNATLVFLPGAGHGGPEFVTTESRNRVETFLDAHLKTPATSTDFSLSVNQTAKTVEPGGTLEVEVATVPTTGSTGTVALSVALQPATSTIQAILAQPTVPLGGKTALSIQTKLETPPAAYAVTITGQVGTLTRVATVTLTVSRIPRDTTPPTVEVLAPAQGVAYVSAANLVIDVLWRSNDNTEVISHSLRWAGTRNGAQFAELVASGLAGTTQQFQMKVTTGDAVENGQFTVEAVDGAGNQGRGQSGRFSIQPPEMPDTEKPVVTGVTLNKTKVKRKTDPTLTISWQSRDNRGVVQQNLTYASNGVDFTTSVSSGLPASVQSFTWTISSTLAKSKVGVVKVSALDAAGNSGEAVSARFQLK